MSKEITYANCIAVIIYILSLFISCTPTLLSAAISCYFLLTIYSDASYINVCFTLPR